MRTEADIIAADGVVPDAVPPARRGDGLARNALVGYLATAAGTLTGFFVTPLLVRHLGGERFGIWTLLLTVTGYAGLLQLGLYATVAKRVAESLAVGDAGRLERVLGTASVMYAVSGAAALGFALAAAAAIGALFGIRGQELADARRCLVVLGVSQAVSFTFALYPSILFGAGRLDRAVTAGAVVSAAAAGLNALLACRGFGVVALGVAAAAGSLAGGLLTFAAARLTLPGVRVHPSRATRATARELLNFGSRNALLSVAGTIAFGSDMLVVGLLLPVSQVANYAIASRLINFLGALTSRFADVSLPACAAAYARGDGRRLADLFTDSVGLSMAFCLPFTISAVAFGGRLVTAWVGPGHEAAGTVLLALAVMHLIQLPGHASLVLMTGTERNKALVVICVASAAVNFGLSWALTRTVGLVGPAAGSLATVCVSDFLLLPALACRGHAMSYRGYVTRSLLPLAGPLAAGAAVAVMLARAPLPVGRLTPPLMLGAVALVCWGGWLLVGLDSGRRARYLRALRDAAGTRLARLLPRAALPNVGEVAA